MASEPCKTQDSHGIGAYGLNFKKKTITKLE